MRLGVLHVLASGQRRGAETFGFELHKALGERGIRSDICCLQPGPGDRGLPVRALASSRFSLTGLRRLRNAAARSDVVVAHGSSTLLACGVGLIGLRVPFVYVSIGDPRYWAGSRLRRMRSGWLIRRAAAVVAIAPSARDVLVEHYRLDERQVRVIPNGRSATAYSPADSSRRASARSRFGVPPDTDTVAIIGALSREKRVDVAIEAIARLDDTVLLAAGDGSNRSTLEAHSERLAPGRVRFLGATDGPLDVLAAADLVVLSSDSEGVPGVLIEAGLAGLPVVATDVGWVRDVVRHGVTGLVVPPGRSQDLAAAVREGLQRRHEFGRAARAHCVAEFDLTAVTDKWHHTLLDVVQGN